ncbi:MAG: ComEC/Rec2 family competence protein, partial [Muribaculaceae bacterium]|nr:ComEC/Rec2 family competence protein [Muribaculaceae bacterium]
VAVAAILAAAWVLDPLRVRMSPLVFRCVSFVAVSVAAVAGTGILSAYHFHVMPLWFIIANIGVALFLPVIICSGILLVLCTWMGFDVAMLCSVIDVCVTAVCRIAGWVSAIPGALLSGIYFSAWLMIPYFGIVACLLLWARFHRWIWPVAVIMLSVAIVALHVSLRPTYPSSELFVTRERYHTNIIMRCGDVAALFTTARSGSRGDVIDECLAKYSSYLERRGVSGLTDMTERLVADGNVIEFGSMLIRVVDSWIDTDILPDRHYDYLLVCRGFKGDIVNLAEQLSADTVLLSADINSIRCSRYVSELRDARVAYRSLRDGALHLVEPANCR